MCLEDFGPKGKILAVDGRPMSELERNLFKGRLCDPDIIKKVEHLIGLRAVTLFYQILPPT